MYLNKWTLDFSPKNDVPSIVSVWVWLLHLLHCWSDDALRCIGNSIGRYIDCAKPKENIFSCARICVKVDLEKGILEAMVISLDNWQHVQQLDYKQLPFKCKIYHEYGHFARNCKKADSSPVGPGREVQWQAVSRKFGNDENMPLPLQWVL
jgi:hypothetical protein